MDNSMKVLCCIVLIHVCVNVLAQPKLVLLKGNKVIARFEEGDHIRFERKDLTIRTGIITGIHSDFIKLGEEDTTYVSQIRRIDLRGVSNMAFHTASSGKKLIIAGLVLVLIDLFNNNPSHELDSGIMTVASIFVGSGVLLQFVNNNYFKIGRKKKVGVVE